MAELLDTTTAAVNSALQRARAQIEAAAPTEDAVQGPTTPEQRELLDRYVAVFEDYEITALVRLLAFVPVVVTHADRPVRFAAAVPESPWASSGNRLLAFLGRDPGRAPHPT